MTWLQRIAWLEPFWILMIGALLLAPGRFLPAAVETPLAQARPWLVGALLLGWPLRRLAYGRFSQQTPLRWPLTLLILWLPVTLWASVDKTISWEALSYLAFGLALYFTLLNWPPAQRRPLWVALPLLLFGAVLVGAAPLLSQLTAAKVFQLPGIAPVMARLADLLPGNVNANRIAGAVVVILPFYVALALRRDWQRVGWLYWGNLLAAAAALLTIVLTQSRGSYLATAAAVGVLLLLRWPRLLWSVPVGVAAAVAAVYTLDLSFLFDQVGGAAALNSLEGRLELWNRALYAIADFSFTGIGIGAFDLVIPLLYPFFLIPPGTAVSHAHNLFLQVAVDLGIPGLIAYLALHVNVFVLLAVVLRRRERALSWCLAAGTVGGLVALFVHGLTDAALWGSKPAFLPWLLVALAVLIHEETQRATEEQY